MSTNTCAAVRSRLLDVAAGICSRQWTSLGGIPRPLGDPDARGYPTLIDPEALILMSLVAREAGPRLDERMGWWARVGARFTSVQRMRTLVPAFPSDVAEAWTSFAAAAARHGRAGWSPHATGAAEQAVVERTSAELAEPHLVEDSALLLRLRIGLGVNAKADLLAFLIGNVRRLPLSAATIARELAYSESTTKRAARDMARSNLIQDRAGHPVAYSIDSAAWRQILELPQDLPEWRPWSLLFPFVAHALQWAGGGASTSAYVRASRARDLFEASRHDLELTGIELPRPERFPGEAFEGAFLDLLTRLAEWMQHHG